MAFPQIPFSPGSLSARAPLNGTPTVYTLPVQVPNRRHRIEADIINGTVPVRLELHLFTYPATGYTIRNTFIETVLPAGTHYVAASAQYGTGVIYKIWRQVINTCPAGCVASHALRDVVRATHERLGMPPPTAEDLEAVLAPHQAVPAPAAPPRQQQRQSRAAAQRTLPLRDVPGAPRLSVGGTAWHTFTAANTEATFALDVPADGDYTFSVLPAPLPGQEIYFLTLSDAGRRTAGNYTRHAFTARLTAGRWYVDVVIPAQLLLAPRTLTASLRPATIFTSSRPGLDHPPDGDGGWVVDGEIFVAVYPARAHVQLRVDIATGGDYHFACADVTHSDPRPAPATLTLHSPDGVIVHGPTAPGESLTAKLTPGRWWVDLAVPDFLGRITPRKYRCNCSRAPTGGGAQ